MDADNKARELMLLYYRLIPMCTVSFSRQCALIAVNEMIKELDELLEGDERQSTGVYYLWKYYKEVKQEIEQL